MVRSALIRTLLLALGLALGGTGTYVLPPPALLAVDLEDIARARKLVDEARPWFKQGADTALDTAVRRKGYEKAYVLLKEARNIYVAYLDANPEKEREFRAEFSEMARMFHFVKKMSGFSGHGPRRGHETRPEEPVPPTPPKESGEAPGPPKPPEPPEPEPDPTNLARKAYADLLAYQEAHPGDDPGLYDLCMQFQAEFDPALPEWEKVAMLAGSIADKLNDFFKAETDEDPDGIDDANGDSKDVVRIITALSKTLDKGEPAEQVRAARLLGETRSGAASLRLCKALARNDPALRDVVRSALVAIGGKRTCDNLVNKFWNERRPDVRQAGLDTLIDIARKSDVDARVASKPIGSFVLVKDESVSDKALDCLASLGASGGPGLLQAVEKTKIADKKVQLIEALGASGYYPAAYRLAGYLIKTDKPRPTRFKEAAMKALSNMGTCAIPYMIKQLKNSRCRIWTAETMRQMTGARIGSKNAPGWQAWYRANRPADGCNGYDPDWVHRE